jgi:putative ABC transport system permease protein
MNRHHITFFSEVRESFLMAMNAIVAHMLRSLLTLLGVLVGVFSIIVVMTAMRVLQANIERQFSSLGSSTFMIRKWPNNYFGQSGDLEKYWRRPNLTLGQMKRLEAATTLPASIGAEANLHPAQDQCAHGAALW